MRSFLIIDERMAGGTVKDPYFYLFRRGRSLICNKRQTPNTLFLRHAIDSDSAELWASLRPTIHQRSPLILLPFRYDIIYDTYHARLALLTWSREQ